MIFGRKMPEFYIKIARKFFPRILGGHVLGGHVPPPLCPPSPTPMVLTVFDSDVPNFQQRWFTSPVLSFHQPLPVYQTPTLSVAAEYM